jgi:hypothetical protein
MPPKRSKEKEKGVRLRAASAPCSSGGCGLIYGYTAYIPRGAVNKKMNKKMTKVTYIYRSAPKKALPTCSISYSVPLFWGAAFFFLSAWRFVTNGDKKTAGVLLSRQKKHLLTSGTFFFLPPSAPSLSALRDMIYSICSI